LASSQQLEAFADPKAAPRENPLREQFVSELPSLASGRGATGAAVLNFDRFLRNPIAGGGQISPAETIPYAGSLDPDRAARMRRLDDLLSRLEQSPVFANPGPINQGTIAPRAPFMSDSRPTMPPPTAIDRPQNLYTDGTATGYPNRAPITYAQEVQARIAYANQNFLSQVPSDWNWNAPTDNRDCGPAALAMVMKFLGVARQGNDPEHAEEFITRMRRAMMGHVNHNENTGTKDLQEAAAKYGVRSESVSGKTGVDAALDRGELVIAMGIPDRKMPNGRKAPTWAQRLSDEQYDHSDMRHFVLIAERDNRGNYIVNDPLSKIGALSVTPQEMAAFISAPGSINGGVGFYRTS
jgi:hypothetical protein